MVRVSWGTAAAASAMGHQKPMPASVPMTALGQLQTSPDSVDLPTLRHKLTLRAAKAWQLSVQYSFCGLDQPSGIVLCSDRDAQIVCSARLLEMPY